MACGQSADMSTSSYRCFLDSQVVHMKQASTFDVQLSPGCPWCGQVGNQVWCNEVAMWRRAEGAGPAGAGEHTAEAHCRCVLKGSWVCGSFFGYGCHLLLFLVMTYVTVAYSMFGYETITLLELLYPLPLDVHPSTPRRSSMLDPSTSALHT